MKAMPKTISHANDAWKWIERNEIDAFLICTRWKVYQCIYDAEMLHFTYSDSVDDSVVSFNVVSGFKVYPKGQNPMAIERWQKSMRNLAEKEIPNLQTLNSNA